MFTFISGQSKPGATVGPVLAKNGINIMKFVKEFTAATEDVKSGVPMRVKFFIYDDKTWEWQLGLPATAWLVKASLGIPPSEDDKPGKWNVPQGQTISLKHVYEIAKIKVRDRPDDLTLRPLCKSIVAMCRQMGIKVVPRLEDM